MATKYGKTWWGEQWLGALKNIDYSNRLPRGASYARNGMVQEINFSGNIISAKAFYGSDQIFFVKKCCFC